MGRKAGALLWRRMRIQIPGASTMGPPGVNSVDTGLMQPNKSFADYSPNEPPLGVTVAPPGPADGTPPASRIEVIPMSPIPAWTTVTHGEPFVNPATGTIWVTFTNTGSPDQTINVFFWDPHSMVGPGQADTYRASNQ